MVAVLAVLPLIPLPLPVTTAAPVPAGWQAAFSRLRLAPGAPVLVVPVPYEEAPQALRWQADTGQPGSLIGGWFIGPDATGHAALYGGGQVKRAGKHLNALLAPASRVSAPSRAQVRADLAAWRPAAVVAVTQPSSRLARAAHRPARAAHGAGRPGAGLAPLGPGPARVPRWAGLCRWPGGPARHP